MKLNEYVHALALPLANEDVQQLLRLLDCRNRVARGLSQTLAPIDDKRLQRPGSSLPENWDGIAVRHCAAVLALYANDYVTAYTHQSALVSLFFRWFQEQPAWPLPVLYLLLRDLRELAEQADTTTYAATGRMPAQEECTRTVSKAFSICVTDRQFSGSQSRRTGAYHTACLSIKCYFKVGKPNLCKNIIRAVTSDPLTPSVDEAPRTDQVTWHFYIGMLAFLAGDDKKAFDELSWAFLNCPVEATRNQELILTYLIPLRLLRGSFPRPALLDAHPRLKEVYAPFVAAIRNGDIEEYDERLEWAQPRLVGMSTYLAIERAREGCLRVLFKKAWLASDKSTRVPVSTFQTALKLHGVVVDSDEVEGMLANMIYRGYIKGYISHEKQMVVLAKNNPFPQLASIPR